MPVVGTAIGSIVGSYIGGWLGGQAGAYIDSSRNETPGAGANAALGAIPGMTGIGANAAQGGEIKVKVQLDDSLKMGSMQTTSYGGMNLYTGGAPLY